MIRMKENTKFRFFLTYRIQAFVSLLCIVMVGQVRAQWTTQTISLKPGFNAVYLEVQPNPNDCDILFDGIKPSTIGRVAPRSGPRVSEP